MQEKSLREETTEQGKLKGGGRIPKKAGDRGRSTGGQSVPGLQYRRAPDEQVFASRFPAPTEGTGAPVAESGEGGEKGW